MSRKLPFWGMLSGEYEDDCLLEMNLSAANGRHQILEHLGVTGIDVVDINRGSNSVSYMTDDDLHTLKR